MFDDTIAQLALSKNFYELDAAERALLPPQMSPEAYDQLRTSLQAARRLEAEAMPPADLKLRLLRHMAAQPRPGLWSRGLRAQAPVWQAVAGAVVLIGAIGFWARRPMPAPAAPVVERYIQRDTIRDTIWREKVIWRERIRMRELPPVPIAALPDTHTAPPASVAPGRDSFNLQWSILKTSGTSMRDVPELFNFLGESRR